MWLTWVGLLELAGCGGGDGTSATSSVAEATSAQRTGTLPSMSGSAATVTVPANTGNLVSAGFTILTVAPSTADPAASDRYGSHIVIPPVSGAAPVNTLFVFLPGTQGVPNLYELILKAGAGRGFHTIGLAYPDPKPVGDICLTSTDQNCFWDVRQAVITGSFSQDISIAQADAIVTRLQKLLVYLNLTYPNAGWGQYLLGNGAVNWSEVVVGGHSQGGGHAAVMAKNYSLSRACYFASPPDWNNGTMLPHDEPAAWEGLPGVTPSSSQFGFAGLNDTSVPWSQLQVIWQALGLSIYGAAVEIDTNSIPSGTTSHMFTTDLAPNTSSSDPGNPSHGITVRDAFTPLNPDGSPVFDPAWGYLCFTPSPLQIAQRLPDPAADVIAVNPLRQQHDLARRHAQRGHGNLGETTHPGLTHGGNAVGGTEPHDEVGAALTAYHDTPEPAAEIHQAPIVAAGDHSRKRVELIAPSA